MHAGKACLLALTQLSASRQGPNECLREHQTWHPYHLSHGKRKWKCALMDGLLPPWILTTLTCTTFTCTLSVTLVQPLIGETGLGASPIFYGRRRQWKTRKKAVETQHEKMFLEWELEATALPWPLFLHRWLHCFHRAAWRLGAPPLSCALRKHGCNRPRALQACLRTVV